MLTFRYKEVTRPDGTTVRCPVIPIRLFKRTEKGENIDALALLDSGADVSAMSLDFAELFSLNLSAPKIPGFGVGGEVKLIPSKVKIRVLSKRHGHLDFVIPIHVAPRKYNLPILLGRKGFFSNFKITFNQGSQKVTMKQVNGPAA